MILTKLDRYLYESKLKEFNEYYKLSFDKLIEKLVDLCCEEREMVISKLPKDTRDRVLEIIEGGLL